MRRKFAHRSNRTQTSSTPADQGLSWSNVIASLCFRRAQLYMLCSSCVSSKSACSSANKDNLVFFTCRTSLCSSRWSFCLHWTFLVQVKPWTPTGTAAVAPPRFTLRGALVAMLSVRALAAENRAAAHTPAIAKRAERNAPLLLCWRAASEAPACALLCTVVFYWAPLPPWWCPAADTSTWHPTFSIQSA